MLAPATNVQAWRTFEKGVAELSKRGGRWRASTQAWRGATSKCMCGEHCCYISLFTPHATPTSHRNVPLLAKWEILHYVLTLTIYCAQYSPTGLSVFCCYDAFLIE